MSWSALVVPAIWSSSLEPAVSMGAPANLLGFKGFAREIAEPRIRWAARKYRTAFDTYPVDAERAGVYVLERARNFLRSDRSHNPLHEYLVGILS